MRLPDKIALITGGTGGIGKSIARVFAQEGAEVVIMGRTPQKLNDTIQELGFGTPIIADIRNEEEIQNGVNTIIERFGRIDILVNGAGIHPKEKPLHEIKESEWNEVIDINLTGQFRVTKAVIPHMIANGKGSIINISSDAGLKPLEDYYADAYVASKAALVLLTKAWALEYAKNQIRVNCVCPGMVDTEMTKNYLNTEFKKNSELSEHPLGRIGKPEDVAKAILYFASDDSSWTTGAILSVDGGSSVK